MSAVGPFDAHVQTAARRLLDAGCISDVRVLQNGRVVTGIAGEDPAAQGAGAPYRVYIRYRRRDTSSGELCPEGECSCGASSPCPHVAAVALFAATQTAAAPAAGPALRGDEAAAMPRSARQCLCYVLDVVDDVCQASLWVAHRMDGGREIPEGARGFARRAAAAGDEHPRYVDGRDRAILDLLPRLPRGRWTLQDDAGFELLRLMVATDRALWRVPHGRTLRWGPARDIALQWCTGADGAQRLACMPADRLDQIAQDLIVGVSPGAYLDLATGECGPIRLPFDLALLRRHWHRPALAPEDVAGVIDWLASQPDAGRFPRPLALQLRPQRLVTLQGHLTLHRDLRAVLHFAYNGRLIAADAIGAHSPTVRHYDGVVHEIGRDPDAEHALRRELVEVMGETPRSPDAWLRFMGSGIPALRARGWTVDIDGDFPYRLAPVADWYADLAVARRADWFDLQLGIVVDGRPVNLLPALVDYLQATGESPAAASLLDREHLFVLLDDGRHLPVPTQRLRRIADTLVELFERDALNDRHALSLPHHQAARLALLLDEAGAAEAPVLRTGDASLHGLLDALREFSGIQPLPGPPECRATLRDYQRAGLGWLQYLRRHRLGGILADDMGLGKTLQTLAHLALEKSEGRLRKPVLIIAPVSVIGNWQLEARRFTPGLASVILHGARRKRLYAGLGEFDVIIAGYPALLFDAEALLAREYSFLILDEAQMIKNPHAQVSQAARMLRADHRLCLTGTPMENHLGDLWSLCDFVQPGLLGSERAFQRLYRTPIEKAADTRRADALRRRIAPFLIRRTKDAVARELPAKTEIVESIVLDERQRDVYDGIRLSLHRRVRETIEQHGLARSRITLLDALLKLRQVCCDPRLLGAAAPAPPVPSAKLDWLATALPELIADGRRILLFSQFTSMLRLIESVVDSLSIPYCLLTGNTQGRPAVIERFQSGEVPLFLVSLKAGGAGLNLTAADTVIHYDPWWNPAVEHQATDRAHRIGQARPVFVYKLIAQGTVEEKILQLQADKHALVGRLYAAADATPAPLSAAELESLLAP